MPSAAQDAVSPLDRLATLQAPPELFGAARPLTLRRAWPQGPSHLLLEYGLPDGRRVAGQWFAAADGTPDLGRLDTVARATLRSVPEEVADGGRVAVLRQHGVLLQSGGADRNLPCLAARVAADDATLITHRPERRAVVRLDGHVSRYAKFVRPDRTGDLMRRGTAATAVARAGGFRVPQILSHVPPAGMTVWSALPGRSLQALIGAADGPRAAAGPAQLAGAALASLHSQPPPAEITQTHMALDEAGLVWKWVERTAAYAPQRAAALGAVAADCDRLLVESLTGPSTLVHRDCHDKQVLVAEDGTVGLIDLDTLAVGDPWLDVANMLVHLQLRELQQRWDHAVATAAATAFVDAYVASRAGVTGPAPSEAETRRLAAYAAATRVRLACVYSFRPGSEEVVDALVRDVLALVPGLRARGSRPPG